MFCHKIENRRRAAVSLTHKHNKGFFKSIHINKLLELCETNVHLLCATFTKDMKAGFATLIVASFCLSYI